MAQHSILISADVQALLKLDDDFSRKEGFSILVASSAKDLLKQAREHHPDIIFLIPSMEVDQRNCCRLLKEDSRVSDIPVVAVVNSAAADDLDHCHHARPDDILFTPINSHLFLTSARRILGLAHRSFSRLQTSLVVDYGTDKNQKRVACAYNLSTGGIFISTETPPKVNKQVFISMALPPSKETLHCEGIVTWINHTKNPAYPDIPPGFGVQFMSLNISDLFAIRNFIDSQEKIRLTPAD
nr:PilZ domain-containing protein [uncultured Desulfuromonas sp.]